MVQRTKLRIDIQRLRYDNEIVDRADLFRVCEDGRNLKPGLPRARDRIRHSLELFHNNNLHTLYASVHTEV